MTTERKVAVHLLPPDNGLGEDSSVAVIVDILRASTTITSALNAGAKCVFPCLTIDDARSIAQHNESLLGGERGGVKVEGFDLGNSPTAYSEDIVGDRSIAFTTTNGTKALHKSLDAAEVVIGCFANLSAIVDRCCSDSGNIDIVCAGTDGVISSEDVLFAGLLAVKLCERNEFQSANDATRIAMDFCRTNTENPALLLKAVRESRGGRNLIKLGYDADIEFAANVDRYSIVPTYDRESRSINA